MLENPEAAAKFLREMQKVVPDLVARVAKLEAQLAPPKPKKADPK